MCKSSLPDGNRKYESRPSFTLVPLLTARNKCGFNDPYPYFNYSLFVKQAPSPSFKVQKMYI